MEVLYPTSQYMDSGNIIQLKLQTVSENSTPVEGTTLPQR